MSKARDLADSAQEINILDGKSFLDEDNLASDSATGIASQQSIKAYVDGITTTNITSTGALNSGSITSGFGNIDNGSSTITTTGAITGGSFVIGSADINENDLESIDGITAGTVSASKAVVVNTNKDITGFRNITATGTISGSLSGTLSGAIASTTTATTQAESDDSTKVATTAYVTDKITTLIGGAPSTLNDLNELAAAINDDANYNSTLTTALGTKLPKAGGTMTGDVLYNDNIKAKFGAGSDLQIYSDGTNGYIEEAGGGNLRIITNGPSIAINKGTVGGENMAVFNADGAVQLFYDASQKLSTTSTGIQVTGNIANASGDFTLDVAGDIILDADGADVLFHDGGLHYASIRRNGEDAVFKSIIQDKDIIFRGNDGGVERESLRLDMSDAGTALFSNHIRVVDNSSLSFGASNDLSIHHSSSDNNSYITETGSGSLVIAADQLYIQNAAKTETKAIFTTDGSVSLRHNDATKFETTSSGVNVTGNVTVTGTLDGRDLAADGVRLDTMATNANNYSHPTGNGNNHIPSGGSADQILKYSSAGTAAWADAGGGLPDPVNWNSPQHNFTSGSSWSVPSSIGDDDWVTFYLVGGGGGGSRDGANGGGGTGGAAVIFNVKKKHLPSSITYSIGSGGYQYTDGGNSEITISGRTYRARGGERGSNSQTRNQREGYMSQMTTSGDMNLIGPPEAVVNGGAFYYTHDGYGNNYSYINRHTGVNQNNSVFGGASGGSRISSVTRNAGTSTYGGNGGANGGTGTGANGSVPGGGGGGSHNPGGSESYGGGGSLRIYY